MRCHLRVVGVLVFVGWLSSVRAQEAEPEAPATPDPIRVIPDLPYASTDNPRQQLDLYLPQEPATDKPLPVVAIIHGTFQNPDRKSGRSFATVMVTGGDFAAVSIGYRLSDEAPWPAQIHDCKAAILGTSGGVADLEGTLGEHLDVSSRVACVVDLFGPTNLLALGKNHDRPASPESRLLGGPLPQKKELARQASAITYVSADDPPFLIIHGTADAVIPFQQSEQFVAALRKEKVNSWLVPVERGVHGNFRTAEVPARYYAFFDKYLRDADREITSEPIKLNPPQEQQ